MSDNNEINQIINQAKSEVREEKFKEFLSKNKKSIIIAFIAVMIVSVALISFSSYQASQKAKYSAIFQQSLMDQQAGNIEKSKSGLKQIVDNNSSPSGIRSLASMRYAGILLKEGKFAEALVVYQKINECKNCDAYVKDLGGLLAIRIWMDDEVTSPKIKILEKIKKIEAKSTALRYQISEQRALLEMQHNNLESAYVIFDSISKNPEVDKKLKERAGEFAKIITSKGYKSGASAEKSDSTKK